MLDYIRSGAQSFGVKVAFGIIILVFVFWGIGNFNDRDYSNIVAVVNGEPIVATEFEKAYQNAEEYILRNNPGMTREQLARQHLGRQVLRDLIQAVLLSQEAGRAGIAVTPLELRQAVGKIKAFQDDKGKFDPEAYKRVLAAQRLSPGQYERDLARELLRDKLFGMITASAWVDPSEALHLYNFLREGRVVSYMFLPAAQFMEQAKVEKAAISKWYDEHKADFAIPPRVDISYIALRPEALADPAAIDEKAALAWYEANKGNFNSKEQIRVSHILVPLAPDADEKAVEEASKKIADAKSQIDKGQPFARVADKFNSKQAAGPGGELGWIGKGETVEQFEQAAFAMEPGTISDVVRSPYGLHLIYVQEKRPEGIRPFKEVEGEVRKAMAFEQGSDKLHDALDNLIEDNILQKPMAESAAKYGLQVEKTGLVDKNELQGKLGINAEAAESLMNVSAGAPLDTALDAGNKYIIARVDSKEPAGVRPFADVEAEIAQRLQADKALELAMNDAAALLKKISSEPFDQVVQAYPQIKTSEPMERVGVLEGFAPDPALNEAIFTTQAGNWLSSPFAESNADGKGAMLVRVDKVILPDSGEFAEVEEVLLNSARRQRMEAIYELFMQKLLSGAKVEITNQNLVDRVGR